MKQKYSEEIMHLKFTGKNMKEAYLNACKWYATNVISKDEIKDVQVQFEKQNDSPSIVLRLFVTVDENWLKEEHCKICKEMHRLFYMNDINCQNCNLAGYQNRGKSLLDVKRDAYKERLKNK
jgi:hypothetical protein